MTKTRQYRRRKELVKVRVFLRCLMPIKAGVWETVVGKIRCLVKFLPWVFWSSSLCAFACSVIFVTKRIIPSLPLLSRSCWGSNWLGIFLNLKRLFAYSTSSIGLFEILTTNRNYTNTDGVGFSVHAHAHTRENRNTRVYTNIQKSMYTEIYHLNFVESN